MSENDEYQKNVIGRMGNLDLVQVSGEEDYIVNARGGKIYNDIAKHVFLDIPDSGKTYDVLSVGLHGIDPIATIKIDNEIEVFRLPEWYTDWINHMRSLSFSGMNILPGSIEFGKTPEGSYYAEIL
jgi:hypothetical protein